MFGAEAAFVLLDDIVNHRGDVIRFARGGVAAQTARHVGVVVQIAVTEVPETNNMGALEVFFKRRLSIANKRRNLPHRHGNIMTVQHASFAARRFGNRFAYAPHRFGLAVVFRQAGIDHQPSCHGFFEGGFQFTA